jgi:hypothetical protein
MNFLVMTKKNIFIVLLLIVSSHFSFAQKHTNVLGKDSVANPYSVRYNKLKELYLKQVNSKSFKMVDSLQRSFIKKAQFKGKLDMPLLIWVKTNLFMTKFKNFDEAQKEWADIEAAQEIEMEQNADYYDYVYESILATSSAEIQINAKQDVEAEHPEIFNNFN